MSLHCHLSLQICTNSWICTYWCGFPQSNRDSVQGTNLYTSNVCLSYLYVRHTWPFRQDQYQTFWVLTMPCLTRRHPSWPKIDGARMSSERYINAIRSSHPRFFLTKYDVAIKIFDQVFGWITVFNLITELCWLIWCTLLCHWTINLGGVEPE